MTVIPENEISFTYTCSSGPGGQHVNKVATAVQLHFDVGQSTALSEEIKRRLIILSGHKVTREGVLVIKAKRFRSQERNRQDALNRLMDLIAQASDKPAIRYATKPTKASKLKRLERKKHTGYIKKLRKFRPDNVE